MKDLLVELIGKISSGCMTDEEVLRIASEAAAQLRGVLHGWARVWDEETPITVVRQIVRGPLNVTAEEHRVQAEALARRRARDRAMAKAPTQALLLAAEPLCRLCKAQGRRTPATEVDHIAAVAHGGDPWDLGNLQAACRACHAAKTGRDAAASRPNVKRPAERHPGLT